VGVNLLSLHLDCLLAHHLSVNCTVLESCLGEVLSALIRDWLVLLDLQNVDVGSYLFNGSGVLSQVCDALGHHALGDPSVNAFQAVHYVRDDCCKDETCEHS